MNRRETLFSVLRVTQKKPDRLKRRAEHQTDLNPVSISALLYNGTSM